MRKSVGTPKTPTQQTSILSFFARKPAQNAPGTPTASGQKPPPTETSPNENVNVAEGEQNRKRLQPAKSPQEEPIPLSGDDSPPPVTTPVRRRQASTSAKRRRIVESDDDDEVEDAEVQVVGLKTPTTTPVAPRTPMSSGGRHRMIAIPSDEEDVMELDEPVVSASTTPKRAPPKSEVSTPKTPNAAGVSSMFDAFREDGTSETPTTPSRRKLGRMPNNDDTYLHESFEFLKPENIKDASGRRPTDPLYDPKTLYVPEKFMREQSPGHRQWWTLKARYFDTILFFKVGKFYELYHMDAALAIECLDLTPMRGAYAHCGFPEIAYGKYADMLVSRGYKVARIEQTETPDMLSERAKVEKVKDKVVRRELCRVTTASTRSFGVMDSSDDKDFLLSVEPNANYLMAVVEQDSAYGVCLIDTSVGKFILSQFDDDTCRSVFRTLVSHFQPCHVVYPKASISPRTQTIFTSVLAAIEKEPLFDKKEFYMTDKVVSKLMDADRLGSDVASWPPALTSFFDTSLSVPKSLPGRELAVRALGGIIFYLERCLIDVDMITMRLFDEYVPPLVDGPPPTSDAEKRGRERWTGKRLVLDGATLLNLHIVPPVVNRRAAAEVLRDATALNFSLFATVDRCRTPFGKRLLRQWMCSPVCDPATLTSRQDAVEFLMSSLEGLVLGKHVEEHLRKMPDLERLLQKIHTVGLKYRASKHPDGRAQLFFAANYNKRKVVDLMTALEGFGRLAKLAKVYQRKIAGQGNIPELIVNCLDAANFPNVADDLDHFEKAFDHAAAIKTGQILPHRGLDKDYDEALRHVDEAESECKAYLAEVRKRFKTQSINLFGSGKARYLLEVAEAASGRLPSTEFAFKSQRKGFKRFATTELNDLVRRLFAAEAERDEIIADSTRRFFEDFASRKPKWTKAFHQIAMLDCLVSLAEYARHMKDLMFPMCRPTFDFDADEPFLDIRRGFHPLLITGAAKLADGAPRYVPNDTLFGSERPLTMLLTGPNMGGKSTLMRQIAVLVILAQMGSPVPADSMRLTPADRVFSRIGAHDATFAGQSTFFVELNETNTILKKATRDSFVVIDELGRGTSTNDGTAIAAAVLRDIASRIQCRTIFSTHYFALCDLVDKDTVAQAHMNFMIDSEADVGVSDDAVDLNEENIIYLYNLAEGPCKKSYGFYAARIAGVPASVVREAATAAGVLLNEQRKRHFAAADKVHGLRALKTAIADPETTVNQLADLIRAL